MHQVFTATVSVTSSACSSSLSAAWPSARSALSNASASLPISLSGRLSAAACWLPFTVLSRHIQITLSCLALLAVEGYPSELLIFLTAPSTVPSLCANLQDRHLLDMLLVVLAFWALIRGLIPLSTRMEVSCCSSISSPRCATPWDFWKGMLCADIFIYIVYMFFG